MCRAREPRTRACSGSWPLRLLATAALVATCVSPATAGGVRLDAPLLAARVDGGAFEFRGMTSIGSGTYLENHVWRFSSDGELTGVGTIGRIWGHGGYGDQALPAANGAWKAEGNQICIEWNASYGRFNGCYNVLAMTDGRFALVGPQILNGTMKSAAEGAPVATMPAPCHRGAVVRSSARCFSGNVR